MGSSDVPWEAEEGLTQDSSDSRCKVRETLLSLENCREFGLDFGLRQMVPVVEDRDREGAA